MLTESVVVSLPAHWSLPLGRSSGGFFYLLVSGRIQLFARSSSGKVIDLAVVEAAECVGLEQLLVDTSSSDGLQAVTSVACQVLRIPALYLRMAIARSTQLAERLSAAALDQQQASIALRSAVVDSLMFGDEQSAPERISLAADTFVFRQGEAGDAFYLIIDGSVRVVRTDDGVDRELAILHLGQPFGELAILRQEGRQATVQTVEPTTLLKFSAAQFRQRFSSDIKLREYLQTLQKLYPTRTAGTTRQFNGHFEGRDCVVSFFRTTSGHPVSSSHVVGDQIVHSCLMGRTADDCTVIRYEDPARNVRLRVQLVGHEIISITAWTLWRGLGPVYERMLTGTPLSEDEIQRLRRTGCIIDEIGRIYTDDDLACHCLQVSFASVFRAVRAGASTVDQLCDQLQCGSICGACRPSLQEVTAKVGWNAVQLSEQIELCADTRRITFIPNGSFFKSSLPGQHVVIRALVEGDWVSRPYMLTSAAGQRETQEITVRRQRPGRFTS